MCTWIQVPVESRGIRFPQELELQAVLNHLTWLLETELRSSGKQYVLLTAEPPFQHPPFFLTWSLLLAWNSQSKPGWLVIIFQGFVCLLLPGAGRRRQTNHHNWLSILLFILSLITCMCVCGYELLSVQVLLEVRQVHRSPGAGGVGGVSHPVWELGTEFRSPGTAANAPKC